MHDVYADVIAAQCVQFERDIIDKGDAAKLPDIGKETLVQALANLAGRLRSAEGKSEKQS